MSGVVTGAARPITRRSVGFPSGDRERYSRYSYSLPLRSRETTRIGRGKQSDLLGPAGPRHPKRNWRRGARAVALVTLAPAAIERSKVAGRRGIDGENLSASQCPARCQVQPTTTDAPKESRVIAAKTSDSPERECLLPICVSCEFLARREAARKRRRTSRSRNRTPASGPGRPA